MEGNLYSIVNGAEMIIDTEVWKKVAGINMDGVCKFEESMDGYNKMKTNRGMLLDLLRILRNQLGVGGLIAEDRILVYSIHIFYHQGPAIMLRLLMTTCRLYIG